jgi:hypothetical protein
MRIRVPTQPFASRPCYPRSPITMPTTAPMIPTYPLQAVEWPLKVSQTAAIMEVVHSLVGLVRSPVGITGGR